MKIQSKIAPCLWFDGQAEEAARFYTSVFPDSKITSISHYGEKDSDARERPAGSVLMVCFELAGQFFTALNAGPHFTFNPAVSFQVYCDTQEELDHYWDKLSEGGDPQWQQCSWLQDRFGLSWQIVPSIIPELLDGPSTARTERVMKVVMASKKLNIAELLAAAGE